MECKHIRSYTSLLEPQPMDPAEGRNSFPSAFAITWAFLARAWAFLPRAKAFLAIARSLLFRSYLIRSYPIRDYFTGPRFTWPRLTWSNLRGRISGAFRFILSPAMLCATCKGGLTNRFRTSGNKLFTDFHRTIGNKHFAGFLRRVSKKYKKYRISKKYLDIFCTAIWARFFKGFSGPTSSGLLPVNQLQLRCENLRSYGLSGTGEQSLPCGAVAEVICEECGPLCLSCAKQSVCTTEGHTRSPQPDVSARFSVSDRYSKPMTVRGLNSFFRSAVGHGVMRSASPSQAVVRLPDRAGRPENRCQPAFFQRKGPGEKTEAARAESRRSGTDDDGSAPGRVTRFSHNPQSFQSR